MANIAKVQLTDTIDFQRRRINEVIDVSNNINANIIELDNETNLPSPANAEVNIYLLKNHTKYKGVTLACLVNGVWKFSPLKNDVISGNNYIYVDATQLDSLATINKCVYLDRSGIWKLADCDDPGKLAEGIVGPYNSIILNGIVSSTGLALTPGTVYYYDNNGNITTTVTRGRVGAAINNDTIALHIVTTVDEEAVQADWNQTNTAAEDYIKNKPGVFSKTADGFVPKAPNETQYTKYLRQDGTWVKIFNEVATKTSIGLIPALPNELNITNKFLCQDASWKEPPVVSKTAPGYAPQLPNETSTTKFLRQDGTWVVPPTTTYNVFGKGSNGLVPGAPNETTVTKFLRQDGTWATPPSQTDKLSKSGGAMTATLSDVNAAQVRNIQLVTAETSSGTNGTIYGVLTSA